MKTMKMPKDRFNKLADERELRCPNATYILINGAERDKGVLMQSGIASAPGIRTFWTWSS